MSGSHRTASFFIAALVAGIVMSAGSSFALKDGLCLTPPMGWSSWNWFGCLNTTRPGWHGGINEAKVVQMADAMVTSGMRDAGYRYINIDDCYLENARNASGGLVAKRATFPKGIRAVADSVHNRGLKFGIYSCCFEMTCAEDYDGRGNGQPGMWGHEQQDADTFVAWGIDYAKIDYCGFASHPGISPQATYAKIGKCLKTAVANARANGNTSARDIVFSVCEWGRANPKLWADTIGHLWRTGSDIGPIFSSLMSQINNIVGYWQYSGPGGWNDPDMMQVGNGLAPNEDRVHFCLWSVMAAPMIAGNDLTNMNAATKALLSNPEANAINQDSLGLQGRLVKGTTTSTFVMSKKLRGGSYAVLFVNASSGTANVGASLQEIGSIDPVGVGLKSTDILIGRDLLGKVDLGSVTGGYARPVPSHDAFFFKLTPAIATRFEIDGRLAVKKSNVFDFSMERTNANVVLHSSYKNPVSFTVVDLQGVLLQKYYGEGQADLSIPLGQMSRGVYFVSMKTGNKSVTKKLIIK